jgi:hypothetical protein
MRTWTSRPLIVSLSVFVFLILTCLQTYYCFVRPVVSPDTFAYVAIIEDGTPQQFADGVRACALDVPGPKSDCDAQIADPTIREIESYSASDFQEFLRFYRVKPLYTGISKVTHLLSKTSPLVTLRIVSAGCYLIICITVALWLAVHLSVSAACLLAFLLCCTAPVLSLGKFLLPDALLTALLLGVTYLVLYKVKSLGLQIGLLATLPFARTDTLIYALLFAMSSIIRSPKPKETKALWLVGLLAGAAALNLLLQRITHSLSFVILFNHSFLTWTPPSSYPTLRLSVHDYLRTVLEGGFKTIALNYPWPFLFSVLALASDKLPRMLRDLVWVSLTTAVARLVFFPNMEQRYYTWLLMITVIASIISCAEQSPPGRSWLRKPALVAT